MSKGGKAPKAPNYTELAYLQGQQNTEAARLAASLNRTNQVAPWGSSRWVTDADLYGQPQQVQNNPPAQPIGRTSAPTDGGRARGSGMLGDILRGETAQPTVPREPGGPTAADRWTNVIELSPEQQQLYDLQVGNATGAGAGAANRLNQVAGMGAPDFSGLPRRVSGVQTAGYRTNINAPSVAQSGVEGTGPYRSDINAQSVAQRQVGGTGAYRTGVDAPSVARSSLDFSGAPDLTNDFSAERQRVEDSLYRSATGRLDPQFAQADEAMRSRLLNSGIREGSAAWENEMQRASWERQDAYGNARDRAISAGGAEQSRLFADALARRQQSVGETTTAGSFENQAAQQQFGNEAARTDIYNTGMDRQFGQELARGQFANNASQQEFGNEAVRADLYNTAQDRQFGQNVTRGTFANEAAQQRFGNEATRTDTFNRGQDAAFAQRVTNAGLTNQARDSGINEEVLRRSIPMQELLQLYGLSTGGPQPSFNNSGGPVAGPAPANIYGAGVDQYNAQLGAYNANQARNAQTWNSLLSLGTTAAFLSDRRAKRDIEPVGKAENGLTIYRFRYINHPGQFIGVMADEVRERFPHAVIRGDDGLDRVDYEAIGLSGLVDGRRVH